MEVVSKISQKDYVKVIFLMTWANRIIKFFVVLLILLLIYGIYSIFVSGADAPAMAVIFPCLGLLWLYGSTYFGAKRTFKSDRRIGENIRYVFEDKELSIHGESFNATLSWDKVYKVTRHKHWLLIWQNNRIANPVCGNLDENKLEHLSSILNANGVSHTI